MRKKEISSYENFTTQRKIAQIHTFAGHGLPWQRIYIVRAKD